MSLVSFPKNAERGACPAALRAPQTVEETGLAPTFLVELLAKVMFQHGLARLTELGTHLGLAGAVVEQLTAFMRREGLVEVSRRGATDSDVQFDLTGAGRLRAAEWLARNLYTGPAPVTLEAYRERVAAQSIVHQRITQAEVRKAFAGLVVAPELQDQLGTAFNSGRPMLLHGEPGAGKTWLAEHLHRLLRGTVLVPHAIAVDTEVVRVFDPHWHTPAAAPGGGARSALDNRARPDARWVACERPRVVSGGELTLEMLDLSFDARSGFYEAPPHFKANNGLFIVDDLGRQIVTPRELMNRWIVPMERRHDHLMLRNGSKFTIPFDLVLVFSSNLPPQSLDDAAFLRRLGHKIHVGPVAAEAYREIFEQACTAEGMGFDAPSFARLLGELHSRSGRPLLACYPRDLAHLVASRCAYLGEAPALSPERIVWAWNAYFGTAEEAAPAQSGGAAGTGASAQSEHTETGSPR